MFKKNNAVKKSQIKTRAIDSGTENNHQLKSATNAEGCYRPVDLFHQLCVIVLYYTMLGRAQLFVTAQEIRNRESYDCPDNELYICLFIERRGNI